jgi:pyruvate,water dikinase
MANVQPILWFDEISLADVALVGGKGANLGELTRAKLPVPAGFVITSEAYLAAIERSGAREKLRALVAGANADDPARLAEAAEQCRAVIQTTPVPHDVADAIVEAYGKLGDNVRVAVRSSGTSEDASGTSFAGMNATFTNVAGTHELLARVVDCWASLYGQRVISYRAAEKITEEPAIAVIVQEMVPSESSGVMFTADPSTGNTDRLVIEAVFGQGEAIVSGAVEPDTYLVRKGRSRAAERARWP